MSLSARPVVLASALALLCGCGGGSGSGDAETAPAAPEVSEALDATLVVHPPRDGRRRAVLRVTAAEPVATVDVEIALPDGCRVVAGAQRRTLESLPVGEPKQSFVIFECDAGTTGEVSASVTGADAAGRPIEESLRASL